MAQGILHSHSEYPINTGVAFNSESLHESSKAKGILELHMLQKEAAQLKIKYEANISLDEMAARQQQHSQFYVNPLMQNGQNGTSMYYTTRDMDTMKLASLRDMGKIMDPVQQQALSQFQKHPLQQQLMHHRLLQQKRHIFQKQVNSEPGMNRRQILRQQSYKFAQQQPVGPTSSYSETDGPLPWAMADEPNFKSLSTDVEILQKSKRCNSRSPELLTLTPQGSPSKTNKLANHHAQLPDCWNDLSGSMQLCQISENFMGTENWMKSPQAQLYFNQQHQQI